MRPTPKLLTEYFKRRFGASPSGITVTPLGRGSHGQGFRVAFEKGGEPHSLIVKTLEGGIGLGHDYPSDRASVFLLARENYNRMPGHARAVDVLALGADGRIFSIDGGKEYYLVMEEAVGRSYFEDLKGMSGRPSLTPGDAGRIEAMASYLARLHRGKKVSPALYYRKLRDTIGHGECLMGVLDTYDGAAFTNLAEMAAIEKACVDRRAALKPMHGRLSRVHGDFHPGNILFTGARSFKLLDRSRGSYGEPADDVAALTVNYVFFSLISHGAMAGAFDEAIRLFYERYVAESGDRGVMSAAPLFYAFRGVVIANPLFYPAVEQEVRVKLFGFVHGVLSSGEFDPARINNYIKAGTRTRRRFF